MTEATFTELKSAVADADENWASDLLERILSGDAVDWLRSSENQVALAERVNEELNCGRLVARAGVRLVAWAAVGTLTLGGTKLADGFVRRVAGSMVGSPKGRRGAVRLNRTGLRR